MKRYMTGKQKWRMAVLTAMVTSGLMGGVVPSSYAVDYNQELTGSTADASWLKEGTVKNEDDGTVVYDFGGKNQSFSVIKNTNAISLNPNAKVTINNHGGTLKLNAYNETVNSFTGGEGLSVTDGGRVTINSNLDITAFGDYHAFGINVDKSGSGNGEEAHLTVNGNVTMRKSDVNNPWAITSNNIHGNYGPGGAVAGDAPNYTGARWAPVGISLGIGFGSTIDINGDVDLAVRGTGVKTDPYYRDKNRTDYDISMINLNGGNIKIETPEDLNPDASKRETYYALANYGGTINVNVKNGQAGEHDVTLLGNIITLKNDNGSGGDMFYRDGRTNIGLSTEKSSWTGIIDNSGGAQAGEVNVWLQNGATWTHQSRSQTNGLQVENMPFPSLEHYGRYDKISHVASLHGGSKDRPGYIIQNDKAKMNINHYSGNVTVIYAHTYYGQSPANYTAGDIVIKNADAGSMITLSTDNAKVDVNNPTDVSNVLNSLAQKLTYSAYKTGERNLKGQVQIASGLTSSSQALKVGNIVFNSNTGKGGNTDGGHTPKPDHQTIVKFTTGITGVRETDNEYIRGGVLQEDGRYEFTKDSDITLSSGTALIDITNQSMQEKDFSVDASGSALNLKSTGAGKLNTVSAINMTNYGKNTVIKADQLNIDLKNDGGNFVRTIQLTNNDAQADHSLTIEGNVKIKADANGAMVARMLSSTGGALNINGDLTVKGDDGGWGVKNVDNAFAYNSNNGLFATYFNGTKKSGTVTVNGNVDLALDGTGALALGYGSVVNIAGGTIKVNQSAVREHYALAAQSGTVNMNMAADGSTAGNYVVKLSGNVGALNAYAGSTDKETKATAVNLGLSTKDSVWTGAAVNTFTEENETAGYTGSVNLYLSNGATWNNETYGTMAEGFAGSHVTKLTGGSDASHRGYIFQKDSNPLTIDNYSGHTVIYYERTNSNVKASTEQSEFAAGDVKVGKAAAGSSVIMATNNSGIDMSDKAAIEKTLGALAQKLYYSNAGTDTNLKGQVQISEGLTASSQGLKIGDIAFSGGSQGQGGYVEGSVTDIVPDKPPVVEGDYETSIMKGVRSAMTTSMLTWRDNAADVFSRTALLRAGTDGAEGLWARTYGGKTKYDGSHIDTKSSYWSAQVGYDKAYSDGWTAGLSLDYRDGDSDYLLGGQGDEKLYSVGIYGSKDLADLGYFDITAKFGRVENEFHVYNEIGQKLEGDYKSRGYSVSAQYGKRFGSDGGYIEPQLQLTWAHLDDKEYDAQSGTNVMHIDQGSFDSFVGRLGVEAGKKAERSTLYARVSVAHEFAGDVKGTYSANDGGSKETRFDLGDTWAEATLGGSYVLTPASRMYADVTKSFGGDYEHEWEVNAGFRFSF